MIPHETAMSMTNHAAKVAMEVSVLIRLQILTCTVTVLTVGLPVVTVNRLIVLLTNSLLLFPEFSRVKVEW